MTDEPDPPLADRLAERLEGLAAPERRAELVGLLQEHLPEGERAILVGGALVELFTEGQYVTGDVDLVGSSEAIGELLEEAGFRTEDRHHVHEELGLVVEVVSRRLDPERRTERVRWREHELEVLSLEDLIVDRLCAAEFWDSRTDREQARLLYGAHRDRLDHERLRERAEDELVDGALDEIAAAFADDA